MSEIDPTLKREAFAAWDTYRATFEGIARQATGAQPTERALTRNPLTGIIFADGYLAGRRAMGERIAALEAERDGWKRLYEVNTVEKLDQWTRAEQAERRLAALEAALADLGRQWNDQRDARLAAEDRLAALTEERA